MVSYLLRPKKYQSERLQRTFEEYQQMANHIDGKQVSIPELEAMKKSFSIVYLNSTHFASLVKPEHRDTLTFLDGYSFERRRKNIIVIKIIGIGKIPILMKLKKSYPHPECLKIEKDGKRWYAKFS